MRNFIFARFFRNKIFDIELEIQNLMQLFLQLVGEENVGVLDKYLVIYQQMELAKRDLKVLHELVDRNIPNDFFKD